MTTHPEAAMTREQVLEEAARVADAVAAEDRARVRDREVDPGYGTMAFLSAKDIAARIRALASTRQEPSPAVTDDACYRCGRADCDWMEDDCCQGQWQNARATIAELEKRIGELEAECNRWEAVAEKLDLVATAERQRRESAEIALRDVIEGTYSGVAARAHFVRYPSESDNRTKVAGC